MIYIAYAYHGSGDEFEEFDVDIYEFNTIEDARKFLEKQKEIEVNETKIQGQDLHVEFDDDMLFVRYPDNEVMQMRIVKPRGGF